jgi:flagellar motility protein MotE (MotC chaperone)
LEENEADFNSRVEMRMVDRQTIETYENIDPEQAAILLQNLYHKDNTLATLVMRKISGKKAGRILEAMIPIDKEVSTKIAKEALDYYRPK